MNIFYLLSMSTPKGHKFLHQDLTTSGIPSYLVYIIKAPEKELDKTPTVCLMPEKKEITVTTAFHYESGLRLLDCDVTFTFLSAPAVLQACLSSKLNLEESAARAWMNCRLYSIFTTHVKCSTQEEKVMLVNC